MDLGVDSLRKFGYNVDWTTDISTDVLSMCNYTAIKNVGKQPEKIYKNS
jgi:hypothetical protein